MQSDVAPSDVPGGIAKAPTGIAGLDHVTEGGFPRGRPTLVCGSAGSGKTLLAMEFLVRGARDHGEPGVFLSFEESAEDLADNVASLGYDLRALEDSGRLRVEQVRIRREEIEETGAYDLEGLFVRLGWAIDQVKARRVAIDTLEALFAGLRDQGLLRAELRRLFEWLKERGMTAVITAERGEGALTRHGLEEYVSDCVLLLDHRVQEEISTRRLRVVKYRGSAHGTNEYPFLLDREGFTVLPVTALGLEHEAPQERISTGVEGLDELLGGGVHRACSVLVTGAPGTGKTSFAATLVDSACARGETCVFFSLEESPKQILRNLGSIGLDLDRWIDSGKLTIDAERPTSFGVEAQLVRILRTVERIGPAIAVVDPMSALEGGSTRLAANHLLLRVMDHLKSAGITGVYTAPSPAEGELNGTPLLISSVIDAWLALRDRERDGERRRELVVIKGRGLAHSRAIHGYSITGRGIVVDGATDGGDAAGWRQAPLDRARPAGPVAARSEEAGP